MRWSHAHSIAVGVAGGLVLDRHVLLVFALGATLGFCVAVAGKFLRAAKHVALERGGELHRLAVERMEAEIERKKAAAKLDAERAEHRSRTKDEQTAAEDRAYVAGVADGAHS